MSCEVEISRKKNVPVRKELDGHREKIGESVSEQIPVLVVLWGLEKALTSSSC